jgi:hypothetical protein
MAKLNMEKLKAILSESYQNTDPNVSSLVYTFVNDMGMQELNDMKETMDYKFLLGLEIIEEE